MSARIPVILNPAANSTQAATRENALRALLPAPELILTKAPGEATEIAEKLAREGHEIVVAAGGDGINDQKCNSDGAYLTDTFTGTAKTCQTYTFR